MAGCQYCGGMHPPLYACEARRKANKQVVTQPTVVTHPVSHVVTDRRRYADRHIATNRAAYMRAYRARRRAPGHSAQSDNRGQTQ